MINGRIKETAIPILQDLESETLYPVLDEMTGKEVD